MMIPAQWHGEFVADLASERSGLCKFEMMRIAGRALADQAGLCRDECEMDLVSPPHLVCATARLFRPSLAVPSAVEPWTTAAPFSELVDLGSGVDLRLGQTDLEHRDLWRPA